MASNFSKRKQRMLAKIEIHRIRRIVYLVLPVSKTFTKRRKGRYHDANVFSTPWCLPLRLCVKLLLLLLLSSSVAAQNPSDSGLARAWIALDAPPGSEYLATDTIMN